MSGAILSRNHKCKIMGIGAWKNRDQWPLEYVKTDDEIKIFGIFFKNSYRSMVKKNWDYRYGKFMNSIRSWFSRSGLLLQARINILKTFALSRVYYIASVLPLPKTTAKKFEGSIGNFIWKSSGWVLRVAQDELKNDPKKGGLNLVCLTSMAKSLLLSQFLRLLKGVYSKAVSHVGYWIGDSLADLLANVGNGDHPNDIPEYFEIIESLVVEGRVDDIVTVNGWKQITNRKLYFEKRKLFPTPKVETDEGISYKKTWSYLCSSVLQASSQETCFLLVHQKIPVKERLFRIGLRNNPFCDVCPGDQVCNFEHFFCSCSQVVNVWAWVRGKVLSLIGGDVTDQDLIKFQFPTTTKENEIIWLLANYFEKAWSLISVKRLEVLKLEKFVGYLTFKYKVDRQGARPNFYLPWLEG